MTFIQQVFMRESFSYRLHATLADRVRTHALRMQAAARGFIGRRAVIRKRELLRRVRAALDSDVSGSAYLDGLLAALEAAKAASLEHPTVREAADAVPRFEAARLMQAVSRSFTAQRCTAVRRGIVGQLARITEPCSAALTIADVLADADARGIDIPAVRRARDCHRDACAAQQIQAAGRGWIGRDIWSHRREVLAAMRTAHAAADTGAMRSSLADASCLEFDVAEVRSMALWLRQHEGSLHIQRCMRGWRGRSMVRRLRAAVRELEAAEATGSGIELETAIDSASIAEPTCSDARLLTHMSARTCAHARLHTHMCTLAWMRARMHACIHRSRARRG